jgi:hypothetical protein
LKTSSPTAPDREISFDALSDAESLIISAIDESLASATSQLLGPTWRKVELRRFERGEKRLQVGIQRTSADRGGIIVVKLGDGQAIQCTNRSLSNILANLSNT